LAVTNMHVGLTVVGLNRIWMWLDSKLVGRIWVMDLVEQAQTEVIFHCNEQARTEARADTSRGITTLLSR
jgi:hypothetical protein